MGKAYAAVVDPKPTVLIVRCGDPRFQVAFDGFTLQELGLSPGKFVSIVIGGGPAVLAHHREKTSDFHALVGQIVFFLRGFYSIERIVLYGHQHCHFYRTIDHPDKEDREKKDLPRATDALVWQLRHTVLRPKDFKRRLQLITVGSYYASFTNDGQTEIVFEEIN